MSDNDDNGIGRKLPVLLDRKQATEYLGLPKTTLSRLKNGEGPPGTKIGRKIYHRPKDLDDWVEGRVQE